MIETNNDFSDIKNHVGLWCPMGGDETDLARIAENAVTTGMSVISAAPADVAILWPWLEGRRIKIYSRFYITHDTSMDVLVGDINESFKKGADGTQIFLSLNNLSDFLTELRPVREDLFFNRNLSIGIDINDVGPYDWANLYDMLAKLRADSLVLAFMRDTGKKSDFVGRVYAAMDAWKTDFGGALHWVMGNDFERITQVVRLIQDMAPDVWQNSLFFIKK